MPYEQEIMNAIKAFLPITKTFTLSVVISISSKEITIKYSRFKDIYNHKAASLINIFYIIIN